MQIAKSVEIMCDQQAAEPTAIAPGTMSLFTQGFRFLGASGLSFLLMLSLAWFLHHQVGLGSVAAYVTTIVSVSLFNFMNCRHFVFQARENKVAPQFFKFLAAVITLRTIESLVFACLNEMFTIGFLPLVAAVQAAAFVLKFLVFRLLVFSSMRSSASCKLKNG